jgi:hypothetical protein
MNDDAELREAPRFGPDGRRVDRPAVERDEDAGVEGDPDGDVFYDREGNGWHLERGQHWATAYHETVDDLRRELASECETFRRRKDLHRGAAFPPRAGAEPADAERDAYLGCLMAGTYAYTLAAVLRVAGEEFGQETAARLASVADDILTNGDDHDRNADVRPADAEASHA